MFNFEYFHTLLPQSVGSKSGAVAPTITPSAAFAYEDASIAEAIFKGDIIQPLYARMGNPTNAKLESILAKLESAHSSIVTSSGMGAISMVLTSFLNSGDRVLCIGGFFGGTYALMSETMPRFGILSDFCDVDELDRVEQLLQDGISMVLIESVGNPNLKIADLNKISSLCREYNTLLVVDNTATPILFRPFDIGADIVIHSTTKNISGHSTSLGGAALFRKVQQDGEKLRDKKYIHLKDFIENIGENAMMAIAKKRSLRDFGMSANAFASFMTLIGLETLSVRLERVCKSVESIASQLDGKLNGFVVRHPSLKGHEHNDRYREFFPAGCGSLLTIDAQNKQRAFKFLDNTKLITQTANIGDNRTLALHMKSTIYRDFDSRSLECLGITDGLIRVSVGLENPSDIVDDFIQASQKV